MATLKARIEALRGAAGELGRLDGVIRTAQETLKGSYDGFNEQKEYGSIDADALLGQILTWVDLNGNDIDYLETVAQVFEDTDERLGREATDAEIQEALKDAGLWGARTDLEIEPMAITGIPLSSGYSDDPVNVASGNFYEVEDDLAFGPALPWLAFRRTYNSRHRFAGPFGPGWSSAASARLVLSKSGRFANWRGPDGQDGRFPMSDGRLPGTQGHVVHRPDRPDMPVSLVFPVENVVWHFDGEGRPVLLDAGPGEQVRFSWRDERLLGMRHVRGRALTVEWDPAGSRIVAVRADDGRRVTYTYDEAGRLTTVDGPGGRRTYDWDDKDRITVVVDADGVVEAANRYDNQSRVVGQQTPFGRSVRFWYRPSLVTEVDDAQGGPLNVWYHNQQGQLEQVVDGERARSTTLWTPGGQLSVMTDRRGGVTRYAYDDVGHVVRIDHPDGTWEERTWDDRSRLTSVTTPAGTTRMEYEGVHTKPSTVRDPEGGTIHTEIGDDGLVLAVTDPDGARLSFSYDDEGRVTASTDPAGGVRRNEYDDAGEIVATTTPLGHVTRFERDAGGRVTARIDPDGHVWRAEHSPAGRPVATVDPLGHREEVHYGAHGEKTEVVDGLGGVTRYAYDIQGNVAAIVDPLGHEWRTEHDGCQRPVATVDPLGRTWRRRYDAEGAEVLTIAPSGEERAVPRDQAGRPVTLTAERAAQLLAAHGLPHDPDDLPFRSFLMAGFASLPPDAEVETGYDAAGNLAVLRRADGSEVHATYDGCGRPVVLTLPSGATTRFDYTPAGRLSRATGATGSVTRYRYDACGRMSEMVDPNGSRTRLRYDADGNLVEMLDPMGERTRHTYDACGRLLTTTAASGAVTSHEHDAAGRLVAITSPTGGTTRITYDAAGRTVATTDPNGGTTTYEHDGRDNLVAETDPLGARTTHTYDAAGQLVATVDPLGRETRRDYDEDGRPVAVTDPDGTVRLLGPSPDGDCDSDADGGADGDGSPLVRDELGRPCELATPDGQVLLRQEWDVDGHLVAEVTPTAAQRWGYDPAGRMVSHTLELADRPAVTTRFSHDACGRPVAVDDPALGHVRVERDPAGRLTRLVGAGLDERRSYRHGRLTAWARVQAADAAAASLAAEVRYARDPAGRIARARHADGATIDYAYDAAGQLVEVRRGDRAWRFDWDRAGRLTAEDGPEGRRAYDYDAAGQLTALHDPAGTTTISWDGAGRRRAEAGPTGTRSYTWDAETGDLTAVAFEPAGDDDPCTRQLDYDLLGRLCAVDSTALAWDAVTGPIPALVGVGDWRVLGSPLAPALVAGDDAAWLPAVDDRREVPGVDPWGRPAGPGGPVGPVPIAGTELAFGHRQELSIDGLVWLRARAYDPATRSFLSPDQLPPVPGVPWTHNTYQYAANDPVNHADPLGLAALSDEALNDIREHMDKGWWEKHWKVLVAVGVVIAGVALTLTGVGGPLGVALMLAGGALIGGGASYAIQMGTTGEVSWKQVFIDAGIGMVSAGVSGLATRGLAQVGTRMTAPARVATVAASESVINVGAGMAQRGLTDQPVFDWQMIGFDAGVGAVLGGGIAGGFEWHGSVKAGRAAAAANNAPPPVQNVDLPAGSTVDTPDLDTPDLDLPGSGTTPAGTTDPAGVRDPGGTQDPSGTGDPVVARDPDGTQDPAVVRDPSGTQDPAVVRDPSGTQDPAVVRDPAGTQDPTVTGTGEPTVDPVGQPTGSREPQPVAARADGAPTDPTVVNPVDQPRVDTPGPAVGPVVVVAGVVADSDALQPVNLGDRVPVRGTDDAGMPTSLGAADPDAFQPIDLGVNVRVRGADDPSTIPADVPPARTADPNTRLDPELEPVAAAAIAGSVPPAGALSPSAATPGGAVPTGGPPGGPPPPGHMGPGGPGPLPDGPRPTQAHSGNVPPPGSTGPFPSGRPPVDPAGAPGPAARADQPPLGPRPGDPPPTGPQPPTGPRPGDPPPTGPRPGDQPPAGLRPEGEAPPTARAPEPGSPADSTPPATGGTDGPAARTDEPLQQQPRQQQYQPGEPSNAGPPPGADPPPLRPSGPPPDMPPARVLDNEQGWRYGRQAWDGVGDRLTHGQREALLNYGGSAHMGINGNLRSNWPPRSQYVADDINNLDDALRHIPTPEPLSVVRVTSTRAYDRPMDQLAGTQQTDPGFLSTRLGNSATHGAADEMWEGRNLVIAHTYVPQGTPGIFMNHVADYLRGGELLLGRGLPRYVTNARQIDGVWHVDEIIYPPHTYSPPPRVHPDTPPADPPPMGVRPDDGPSPLTGPSAGQPPAAPAGPPPILGGTHATPSGPRPGSGGPPPALGGVRAPGSAAPTSAAPGGTAPASAAPSGAAPEVGIPTGARPDGTPTASSPGGGTQDPGGTGDPTTTTGGRDPSGTGDPTVDPNTRLDPELEPVAAAAVAGSVAPSGVAPAAPAARVAPSGGSGGGGTAGAGSGPPPTGGSGGPPPPSTGGSGGPPPPVTPGNTGLPPRFSPRVPSRWADIADPSFLGRTEVDARFRNPDLWDTPDLAQQLGRENLSQSFKNKSGAFVTVDGTLPPSIARQPDVAADPTMAIRLSGKGHAEDALMRRGDIVNAVHDAAVTAAATGNRSTVRIVISQSPCGPQCSVSLPNYIRNELPGLLQRPAGMSPAQWDDALRQVDLELHTPVAHEGVLRNPDGTPKRDANGHIVRTDTNTGGLLNMESSGLRVVVYQPEPGNFRTGGGWDDLDNPGNQDPRAYADPEGSGGGALNETLEHLDNYRQTRPTAVQPGHWTDNLPPPGGATPPATPGPTPGPSGPSPSAGSSPPAGPATGADPTPAGPAAAGDPPAGPTTTNNGPPSTGSLPGNPAPAPAPAGPATTAHGAGPAPGSPEAVAPRAPEAPERPRLDEPGTVPGDRAPVEPPVVRNGEVAPGSTMDGTAPPRVGEADTGAQPPAGPRQAEPTTPEQPRLDEPGTAPEGQPRTTEPPTTPRTPEGQPRPGDVTAPRAPEGQPHTTDAVPAARATGPEGPPRPGETPTGPRPGETTSTLPPRHDPDAGAPPKTEPDAVTPPRTDPEGPTPPRDPGPGDPPRDPDPAAPPQDHDPATPPRDHDPDATPPRDPDDAAAPPRHDPDEGGRPDVAPAPAPPPRPAWWNLKARWPSIKHALFPWHVTRATPPPPYQLAPSTLHPTHQVDLLIQGQYPHQPQPQRLDIIGQRASDVWPERFVRLPFTDRRLGIALRIHGIDNPAKWIQRVNPRRGKTTGFDPYSVSCGDCMRSYATTRQTGRPTAASGDRSPWVTDPTLDWSGTAPANGIFAQGLDDLGEFQVRGWDQVARQIEGKPPGTVSLVWVEWEPKVANGVAQRSPGHLLGAEVAPDGSIKWVDPQVKIYQDWPPSYPQRFVSIRSMYRDPTEMVWRQDGPHDVTRATPRLAPGSNYTPTVPIRPFEGGTLATHEGLPSLTGETSGQTLSRYTGQSDQDLALRLADDPDLTFQSSFATQNDAEAWTMATTGANSGRIDEWLQQSQDLRLTIEQDFTGWYPDHPSTGQILVRGDAASQAGTGVRLVLERRRPGRWPAYLVVKAQPINPAPPVAPVTIVNPPPPPPPHLP